MNTAAPRWPGAWRSLAQLVESENDRRGMEQEFPEDATSNPWQPDRRTFLALIASAAAFGPLGGCTRQPPEKIVPRALGLEYTVPGRPLYYATAIPFRGIAQPVLVESHDGRPTKIEGNPDHPASLGATSAIVQAALWGLYDPDRSKVVLHRGQIATWATFREALKLELQRRRAEEGRGLHILTEPFSSPTLHRQMQRILDEYPQARWHAYESIGRDTVLEGADLAFGRTLEPQFHLERAEVVLCLDADVLFDAPDAVRHARAFADGRRIRDGQTKMNRLYVMEPTPSVTGAAADHRLAVHPRDLEAVVRELAGHVGIRAGGGDEALAPSVRRWVLAAAEDLKAHGDRSLVVAGESQASWVHALVHAIHERLGAIGRTATLTRPAVHRPAGNVESLAELTRELNAGRVELLVVIGGNPAFGAPADLDFADALRRARSSVRIGEYEDETSGLCEWHLPLAHVLESWSDLRAADGLATIVQPLIAPLYASRTAHEVLEWFCGEAEVSALDLVRQTWAGQWPGEDFEERWRRAVHDGFVADTSFPSEAAKVDEERVRAAAARAPAPQTADQSSGSRPMEVLFRPDPALWDGRYANCPWLQELPKPLTKLTWGNAALLSPGDARRLGADDGQVMVIRTREASLRVPTFIMPGQAAGCLTLHLGHGRRRGGRVCAGVGTRAEALRRSEAMRQITHAGIELLEERQALACTQTHHLMEGRDIVRSAPIARFAEPAAPVEAGEAISASYPLSLYPGHADGAEAWAMSIDLTACIGCNACMVACQTENNVPTVGPDEVRRGREMHWIRVDRYFAGDPEAPAVEFQPVPCMHCENAPCEVVCPVGATVHSQDGLNEMTYNRCIGTRYCANNCPYKVRRFNFYEYTDRQTPSLKLLRNPDVTVRSRGVMEKCTYCVQRISAARIEARKEGRSIRDGDVVTACQAACPSQAIVFGNLKDPESRVALLRRQPQDYALLAGLNTRPRTTYLARFRNPNPALENVGA